MQRHFLLAIVVIVAATACNPEGGAETPATAMLHRIKPIKDAGSLDYAGARKFLGIPLDTFKFEMIANGDRITSRSGEYYIRKGGTYPAEFTGIGFDMAWEAESNRPSTQSWHKEKGLRSSLRVSFDQEKVCITKELLQDEWGRGKSGRFSHGDAVAITYGALDKLLISFTFNQPCADSVHVIANDRDANWPTPADASASDAEFVTSFLPLDKSGQSLGSLGLQCGPSNSTSSKPEDTGCVCPHKRQSPAGPCHYSVGLSDLPEGGLGIRVWALLNPEAN